ncbi:hypothetical protein [Peribacillus alkalitolerans]|uniref:hypothetical protein n=1 Tax=Peribacillus alkalitolerans TaxID=1550385 RepID=UPI0013D32567|nr:hypothetical protein [Peribacillus alkalitolerans]
MEKLKNECVNQLKNRIQGMAFTLEHQGDYEGIQYTTKGIMYNPWKRNELLYKIQVTYDSVSEEVKVFTIGLSESTFSFKIKQPKRAAILLLQYLEILDQEFIESIHQFIIENEPFTLNAIQNMESGEKQEFINALVEALLSQDLPVLDLPSILLEDVFTEFQVIEQINKQQPRGYGAKMEI